MYKIFAGNLAFSTTEEQLRELFAPHMEVEDVVVVRDPESGKSRGYGFVMTRDAERGRAVVRRIGKVEMDGRRVYFREAQGKRSRRRKRGGPSGGAGGAPRHRPPLRNGP